MVGRLDGGWVWAWPASGSGQGGGTEEQRFVGWFGWLIGLAGW